MLDVFVNVVLPVFLVAGLGYAVERTLHLPILPLNQLTLYVLMPIFIFQSLSVLDLTSETPLRIVLFATLLTVVMLFVGWAVARLVSADRVTTSAFLLTAAFPNLGNYGLSVVLLAYGGEAVAYGSVLLGVQTFYGLALATVIASSGTAPIGRSFALLLRQPILYAVALAVVLNVARVSPPPFVTAALALPAAAAIPVMLIVLGMQLAGTRGIEQPSLTGVAVFTRLVIGTAVGWALVVALGIEGIARDVMIVGSAMPTAVFTTLAAMQYGARPRFVSDVVIAGTLASIVTVTAVLTALSQGRVF